MRAVFVAVLVLVAAMTVPGCTTGAGVGRASAPIGEPIQMAPDQRVSLPDGATLRYVAVAADSRCPPGVQCIRAGDADVAFEVTDTAQAPRQLTINTNPPASARIGPWQVRLLALTVGDSPKATVRIDPATP